MVVGHVQKCEVRHEVKVVGSQVGKRIEGYEDGLGRGGKIFLLQPIQLGKAVVGQVNECKVEQIRREADILDEVRADDEVRDVNRQEDKAERRQRVTGEVKGDEREELSQARRYHGERVSGEIQ